MHKMALGTVCDSFRSAVYQFLVYLGKRQLFYQTLLGALFLGVFFSAYYPAFVETAITIPNPSSNVQGVTTQLPTQQAVAPDATSAGTVTVAPSVTPTPVNATPAAQACARGTFTTPGAINMSLSNPGLQQFIEAPQYYQIYGYTSPQIKTQINNCTPVNENGHSYAASTSYRVSWMFSAAPRGDGACTISSVAVGVRVAQVYPYWENTQYATPGYAARWSAFMANLIAHENGHRDLDVAYAQQIATDVQAMPATDCNSIIASAHAIANAKMDALRQANATYDAATGHGATQGAIIP